MFGLPPILAHFIELILLLLLTAIATGVGLRMLALLRLDQALSLGERFLFGAALGYGALAFSMLGMGLLGVLHLPVGLGVLAALALAGYAPLMREVRSTTPTLAQALRSLRYPPTLFLAALILLCVGAALIKTLVPVATQDDLMYHLALPQRYIEAHAIQFYPDITYSLFPQLMEMLYTWGLLLGSDRLSVLFAWSAALIGPAGAALFAKRHLAGEDSPMWRVLPLLVPAIYLSIPLAGYVLRAANTDLAQASFDMLAVYAFWLGIRGRGLGVGSDKQQPAAGDDGQRAIHVSRFTFHAPHARLLLLSGLCCGLSFSTKYYGFGLGLLLGLALVGFTIFGWAKKGDRKGLGGYATAVVAFAGGVVTLAAPWLARNLVEAGNPVWPLGGSVFGGAYWSPLREYAPETLLGSAPPLSLSSLWTGIEYLWTQTTRPPILIDNQTHEVNLGYLLLPALLLLPLAKWRPSLAWVTYAAGGYWLLWALFFSRTSARYLSTFFLLAALLGAYGIVSVAARFPIARWVLGGIAGVLLSALTLQAAWSAGPYLSTTFSLSRDAEAEYLNKHMEDYPMTGYIAMNTPPNTRIYIWDGQPRGYYIPRDYVYARLVPLYTGFGLPDPQMWRARLGELRITHILVHRRDILAPGQLPGADPALEAGRRFSEQYFSLPLFEVGNYSLYSLR